MDDCITINYLANKVENLQNYREKYRYIANHHFSIQRTNDLFELRFIVKHSLRILNYRRI